MFSLYGYMIFVEPACGELGIAVTFFGSVYVRALVRACVSSIVRPDLSCPDYNFTING